MNIYQLLSMEQPRDIIGIPVEWRCQDMSYRLPKQAQEKGLIMLDMVYDMPQVPRKDPIIIFSKHGKILHAWPEGYIPGPFEIEKVGKKVARRRSKQ